MNKRFYTFFLLFIVFSAKAQIKKPLDHTVYDAWQSVSGQKISKDGNIVAYAVTPQEGDAQVYIHNLKTKSVFTYPRVASPELSHDALYAVFLIKPFYQDVRAAKIKKAKPENMPKDTLGIYHIASKRLEKIAWVKSFKLPEKAENVVAYQLESVSKKSEKAEKSADKARDAFFDESESDKKGNDAGALVLRELQNGKTTEIEGVGDYELSPNGKYLLYAIDGSKKDSSIYAGVYLMNIENKAVKMLTGGKGAYKNLKFDKQSSQLAFTGDKSPEKSLIKIPKLYYYDFKADSAWILVEENRKWMPEKYMVNDNGKIYFSENGTRLFFGTSPIPQPKDTSIVSFEVAKVDIWNYQDDYLQPMQLANLDKNLKKTWLAVADLKQGRFMQLGTVEMEDIEVSDKNDGAIALGVSDYGNRVAMQWEGGTLKDAYLLNLETEEQTEIAKGVKTYYTLSPKGKYVVWFNRRDQSWYSYDVKAKKTVVFENPKGIAFGDEENDVPDDAAGYGLATWTKDDQQVLLYDRYDIWAFDPKDGKGVCLTAGAGRRDNITFRYYEADKDEKSVDAKASILLTVFNDLTKEGGFASLNLASKKAPKILTMGPYSYLGIYKAKEQDVYIYEKGNFEVSPDLYISRNFKTEKKLSHINPQQKDYIWGKAELVKWTTPEGHSSEGVLYKPENFDPKLKYPMIVYFYEKLSENLYRYKAPAPTPSKLDITYFVSNGYLVFTPDISYTIGHPGKSAEEYINSGVEFLKKNSWVDGKKIGIQGQSWGGYQVAHLITVTDMYAAAWSGAPVVNMFSAYGGIRWQSGMNRQFQYEKTQSRIGATIWEKPELYMENSPLFRMPNVKTPVVIMANDGDGAVPWYQGIEMFTALRRLNKPVWMLNYNGEEHNLMKRQNRKDIQIREQQFFDHYLKGEPMPLWMSKGVPATMKGKVWGFELEKAQQ